MQKNKLFINIKPILYIMLATSFNLSAQTNMSLSSCINKHSGNKLSACLDTVKGNVDKELLLWVNNQTFVLDTIKKEKGRSAALKVFTRSMKRFDSYREDNCRWKYLSITPEKGADIAYKKCYIELTKTKIDELSKSSQ